jgi:hypothetical protein
LVLKTLSDAACLNEILDRLKSVRPDSPRQWGKMSAHQMICHLNDSLLAAMGRKNASPAERPYGPVMKWLALNMPMKWPQGVPTRPEVDQEKFGTAPAAFDADVQMNLALTEEFARVPRSFNFSTHPIFGNMTGIEWMRWAWLHTDHHLRQFDC